MRLAIAGLLILGSLTCPPALADADLDKAMADINWAWNDNGPCTKTRLCATYFDEFGLHVDFADGTLEPFLHVQRLTTSAHDCIQNAKNALAQNKKGLAVSWVMATQLHNDPEKDWLRHHPDAVLAALKKF